MKNCTAVRASAAAAALLLLSGSGLADENPYTMADNAWITISGTVESVQPGNFTLDYGDGQAIVEMDDGDRDADAYKLMNGDQIRVAGRVDGNFFETAKIEASSVFVKNLGTTFFASSVDEETSEGLGASVSNMDDTSLTVVQGTVTDVREGEFVIDAGVAADLRVAVDQLVDNPLDEEGYQQIHSGDRVRVSGEIDSSLIENRELIATSVVKLNKDEES